MAGGWKNETTWEVAMSIGNDRIIYDYWVRQAFACLDANSTLRSPCCCTEADLEENAIRDLASLLERSLYKTIALSVVAWDEVARHIIADLEG